MIALASASLKVYLALDPCDLRRSFQGLTEIAVGHLGGQLTCEANPRSSYPSYMGRGDVRLPGLPLKRRRTPSTN